MTSEGRRGECVIPRLSVGQGRRGMRRPDPGIYGDLSSIPCRAHWREVWAAWGAKSGGFLEESMSEGLDSPRPEVL